MNYLVLCLDSCRYDSFQKASTPHFDNLGKVKKVYSHAGFTPPSIFGILMNMPQYNEGREKFIKEFSQPCWLPEELNKKEYFTAFITPNPWIFIYKTVFGKGFDTFKGHDLPHRNACKKIITEDIKIFKTVERKKFVFNLFLATHRPYAHDDQIRAIEEVDEEFGRLIPHLPNTNVIVCADHGELFGEGGGRWHNPSIRAVFHPKLFEVPVVRGMIE